MDNTNFILYAHDTNIFVVGKTKEEAFSRGIGGIGECPCLHINMEKCCFMHFQPKDFSESENCSRTVPFVGNNHVSKAIYINCQKLKEVRDTTFLGVIIDNELDWSFHIHELNKKVRSAAALLSKVRHWIPKEHYLKIYYALFESHLTFGISV